MIRFLLLVVCISIPGYPLLAQQKESLRDSLLSRLTPSIHDTTRIQIYQQLGGSYWLSNYDSGLYFAQEALLQSKRIDYAAGELKALNLLGLLSSVSGDYVRGYNYAKEAADRATTNKVKIDGYLAMAQNLRALGKCEEVISLLREYQSINQSLSNENLAGGYCIAGAQMTSCFLRMDQLDSADWYAENTYKFMQEHDLKIPYVIGNLGKMYERLGEYTKAISYYREALFVAQEEQSRANAISSYWDLSSVYKKKDERDSSIYFAELALENAKDLKSKSWQIGASNNLRHLLESSDLERAYKYSVLSYTTAISLIDEIQQESFGRWAEFDQKLQNIEEEKAQEEVDARIRTNALLGSSFTLLVIAFFLYRNNRNKQKAKKQIETAYDQLKSTQSQLIHSEKMASLGELTAGIAHEIQNPLNFVNNFSEVNKEMLAELRDAVASNDQDEIAAILKDLEDNEEKVTHHGKRAEQIVKSMLQHSRTGSGEKELTDINALCDEYLRLAYHGFRAKDKSFNADFKLDLDPNLPKIEVVPQDIGRVLLNLINNAFQAIADSDQPEVVIKTEHLFPSSGGDQGEVQITVSDNGPGIPDDIKDKIFQPFFTTKPTGEGTGLGLSMSYDIVTKGHWGQLSMKSEEGKGTKFIMTLPTDL